MKLRSFRLGATVAALAVLAFPATGISGTADLTIDRGIVQSAGPGQIALRALDGSIATFAVSPATRVRLNGVPATLADLAPGYVATVAHNGSAAAVWIRAFGKPTLVTDRGTVTLLTRVAITIRTDAGALLTVPLDASTQFRLRGVSARRGLARAGAFVAVKHAGTAPAKVVNVLRRARA